MNLWIAALAAAAAIVAFFACGKRQPAKAHARFTPRDVEIALAEVLDPKARTTTLGICSSRGQSTIAIWNPFVRSARESSRNVLAVLAKTSATMARNEWLLGLRMTCLAIFGPIEA